ncbi:hypothetical protein EON62_05650, partial [archaeon]
MLASWRGGDENLNITTCERPPTRCHYRAASLLLRAALATLEYAGIKLKRWLHGFDSVHDSVRNSVDVIRRHPLVPPSVPVHGLIIHPETGALDLVVDG